MKRFTSRQRLLIAVYGMIVAMVGDYLLGFGTFSTSSSPDAYMGMTANVVPDWRYGLSSGKERKTSETVPTADEKACIQRYGTWTDAS